MTALDKITVMSLDRTPERFAKFVDLNPHLPVDRFQAVDGQLLDRWDCVDEGLITAGNPYTLGALGCALSHIRLWQRCAAEGHAIHIAEDDAIFRRDFVQTASAILASLADWDIVLWAWNFDWPMEVILGEGLGSVVLQCNEEALRAKWAAFPASTTAPLLGRLISNSGTCAYSLSPVGAQTLLQKTLPIAGKPAFYPGQPDSQWTNRTIDVEMARHYTSLQAFVTVPAIAVSLNIKSESTIQRG